MKRTTTIRRSALARCVVVARLRKLLYGALGALALLLGAALPLAAQTNANGIIAADFNHDGIPDVWEKAHGLNPADPADANNDSNGDGYTNLEKYLNSLVGEYSFTKN